MTLQQLKYAVAVADTLNITEASKRVFISQPSLTAAIHELEEEMGVTIFNRSNKGVTITNEGDEFLSYARQVLEQAALLEDHYKGGENGNTIFSVSCQHYSFAVNAFVDVIRKFGGPSYDFTLRETQTNEIIDDVAKMKSEIGVLYLSGKNEKVIRKLIQKNNLVFEQLFTTPLHVFMSSKNPLAKKERISLADLKPYPYLTYEQGNFNSFYFAEEPLTAIDFDCPRNIKVRDRATLFNLPFAEAPNGMHKALNDANEAMYALPYNYEETLDLSAEVWVHLYGIYTQISYPLYYFMDHTKPTLLWRAGYMFEI